MRTLHLTPVLHHEISSFRYPFLASHLLLADETDPQLVGVVLRACSDSPVQRQLAQEVRARLFCEKVELLVRARRFEELAHWLSVIAESHTLSGLDALRDAARCLAALDAPEAREHRSDRLLQAERHLDRLKAQLADDLSEWAAELRVLLASWVEVVQRLQRD
jgi:hypothetical protein